MTPLRDWYPYRRVQVMKSYHRSEAGSRDPHEEVRDIPTRDQDQRDVSYDRPYADI